MLSMRITLTTLLFSTLSLHALSTEGLKVYQNCMMCHGYKAEKEAFNRARVLKSIPKEELLAKIVSMKETDPEHRAVKEAMFRRLKNFSHDQLKELVDYIHNSR